MSLNYYYKKGFILIFLRILNFDNFLMALGK